MIDGRKVVVCTPAGRRSQIEILVPYILRDRGIVDEYQLWLNTEDKEDVAYVRHLATMFPEYIKVIERDPDIPIIPENKSYSIHQFFKGCVEPGTVYVRLDDDIVFVDKGAIEELVRFRIANPKYFLVYGNILNNAIISHIHQRSGVIDNQHGLAGYWFTDKVGWENPDFAECVHRWFFHHYQSGSHHKFNCFERWELNQHERVSINAISWLGEDFLEFNGEVAVEEEWWLSQVKPDSLGRMNCIYGNAIFVHYAFFPQKEHLDSTNVLNLYKHVCELENQHIQEFDKLRYVINVLLAAPLDKLKEVDFLEHMILLAGLYPDPRKPYGDVESGYVNGQMGSWKTPRQLAEFLVYAQEFRISSVLDVGSFYGWTTALMTAVLLRFNPNLKVTALDPKQWCSTYEHLANILPITYRRQTTDSYIGQRFDLVFLDGNHEYSAVKRDYENVGRFARLCALHDANDDYIRGCPYHAGGVPALWDELKNQLPSREFFKSSNQSNVMGIGVLVNVGADKQ